MSNKVKYRILFIGYGVLGDFIVCLKSVELLRGKFPDAHITYVGNKVFAQLGMDGYHIDDVLERDEEFNKYYKQIAFHSAKWDKVFKKANLMINHPSDSKGFFVKNMQKLGFVHQTVCQPIDEMKSKKIVLHGDVHNKDTNAYEQVGELLKNIGISTNNWSPKLRLKEEYISYAKNKIEEFFCNNNKEKKNIIAFHPGASSLEKCVSLERWKIIFENILLENDMLIIFPGPAEEHMFPKLELIFRSFKPKILRNYSLLDSVSILSQCNKFFGHDTGFAHIAGALSIPSFLIFGPISLPEVWRPPSKNTQAIFFDDLNNIDTDFIVAKINGNK